MILKLLTGIILLLPLPHSLSCPVQVLGNHEPNVILKDNDLKHKIRLPGPTARFLLKQLEKDTEILCSLGVMDYSLLGLILFIFSFSFI